MNKKTTRWAIVGTGYIANRFASGMMQVADAELTAVVSRTLKSARDFSARYRGKEIYTDFEEMLDRANIDIVYLAIPNDLHYSYIMKTLEHNIPILSEKPIVDTTKQMEDIYRLAEEKGLFIMEGMWTRCFPVVRKVRQWIADGMIGDPQSVNVCFDINPDRNDWQLWKAGIAHAGGSLRDVGIYSLGVTNMVFPQMPVSISSNFHFNGEVDDCCRLFLDYGDGKFALAGGAFNQQGENVAHITGTEGRISFGPEFWDPTTATLTLNNGITEQFTAPFSATGFQYEIMAVQDALRSGKPECPDFTHAESRLIAKIIEDTRKSWGIFYKADEYYLAQ